MSLELEYTCIKCGKKSLSLESIIRHIKTDHKDLWDEILRRGPQ